MRMELRLLIGTLIFDQPWPDKEMSTEELKEQAKDALVNFYEGDERSLWSGTEFARKVPEEVRIVDANGAVVAHYDWNADGCGVAASTTIQGRYASGRNSTL
jgi:hypothetical protein